MIAGACASLPFAALPGVRAASCLELASLRAPRPMHDVSVVVHDAGAAGEGYYVLAGGCSSRSVCDGKGGFAAAFDLKVAAGH